MSGRLVRQEVRDLGDRKDEHQVEEELERCDGMLAGAPELARRFGHAPILSAQLSVLQLWRRAAAP